MMADDARNEIVIERNLLIPMNDGASLSADLYRPAGNGPFPALMSFYPYHKDDMIGASFEGPRRYFAAARLCASADRFSRARRLRWRRVGSDASQRGRRRRAGVRMDRAAELVRRQRRDVGPVVRRNQLAQSRGRKSAASESDRSDPGLREHLCRLHRARRMPHAARLLRRMGFVHARDEPDAADQHRSPTAAGIGCGWIASSSSVPYVLPWFEHPDFDEYWSAKAVDPAKITIPTFIIGGWRDIFPEGMPALYPHLKGPKKLLMGPWMHGLPDGSPYDAIEFLPEMKRWFDHYRARREERHRAGISGHHSCAEFARRRPHGGTSANGRSRARRRIRFSSARMARCGPSADREEQGENYRADPTIGTAAGLWDPMALGVGLAAGPNRRRYEIARVHDRAARRGYRDQRRARGRHSCRDHRGRRCQPGREIVRRRSRRRLGAHHHRMAEGESSQLARAAREASQWRGLRIQDSAVEHVVSSAEGAFRFGSAFRAPIFRICGPMRGSPSCACSSAASARRASRCRRFPHRRRN